MFEFFKRKAEEQPKDVLRSEHLKSGIQPIIACVGTPDQFHNNPDKEREVQYRNEASIKVDYYGDPEDLTNRGIKNRGFDSYVISPIDNRNKFSESFKNCTGLVVTGIDKKTGENISFLTHQDPNYFLKNKEGFITDLKERLEELKQRCEEGTIDAVIVGGNSDEGKEDFKDKYIASVNLLAAQVKQVLGFEPLAITGPKIIMNPSIMSGPDNVFYDTKERRLYIMRPDVGNKSTEPFAPSKINEQKKKW